MQDLVRRYLDSGLSRRGFLKNMAGLGFSLSAARAVLRNADAAEGASPRLDTPAGGGSLEGTGGELVVAQAKAAGVEYLFTNPGSFEAGFFDAFIDTPGIQLIMACTKASSSPWLMATIASAASPASSTCTSSPAPLRRPASFTTPAATDLPS